MNEDKYLLDQTAAYESELDRDQAADDMWEKLRYGVEFEFEEGWKTMPELQDEFYGELFNIIGRDLYWSTFEKWLDMKATLRLKEYLTKTDG